MLEKRRGANMKECARCGKLKRKLLDKYNVQSGVVNVCVKCAKELKELTK